MAKRKAAPQPIVVDTNVLIAANGAEPEWEPIAAACADRLASVMNERVLCVDQGGLILEEYGHRLPSRSRSGYGDMFFLWLARQQYNPRHCTQVTLTPREGSRTEFAEFPQLPEELASIIDPSDRKFIAVANAHPDKPPILEATDSKWIGWRDGLAAAGITVELVDEEFLQPYYDRKMGGGQ